MVSIEARITTTLKLAQRQVFNIDESLTRGRIPIYKSRASPPLESTLGLQPLTPAASCRVVFDLAEAYQRVTLGRNSWGWDRGDMANPFD